MVETWSDELFWSMILALDVVHRELAYCGQVEAQSVALGETRLLPPRLFCPYQLAHSHTLPVHVFPE